MKDYGTVIEYEDLPELECGAIIKYRTALGEFANSISSATTKLAEYNQHMNTNFDKISDAESYAAKNYPELLI